MEYLELPTLPPRPADSHKGDYGRLLLIGGSRGMTGAIALAGMAALRSGAGLVFLALPEDCWQVAAALEPGYLTVPLPADGNGGMTESALPELRRRRPASDAWAIGPGMAQSPGVTNIVRECYTEWSQPGTVDADALNAISLARIPPGVHAGPRILTPHPGEFRRLLQGEEPTRERAVEFARHHDVIMVLKGHRTAVTDGERVYENSTGNPGMATGGSGDVLTGIITALLGQGLAPFDAAQLGVYVHGLSGDLAAKSVGQMACTARDLVDFLGSAWQSYRG